MEVEAQYQWSYSFLYASKVRGKGSDMVVKQNILATLQRDAGRI